MIYSRLIDNKSNQIIYKTEDLLKNSNNRYKTTMQIANRAKRRKYEDMNIIDESNIKPVIQAIMEMSDEMTQTQIIGE
jgi:DNA-directed RNA polymerase subunit omega|uniref:DNA-directed RNA polymerase subunit omega n=1 Tax=Thorea hispida TaxID=202687 RepID=A0A1C9CAH9_9FLOR|nr:DNA-directed RNA polymerase omega chain [Thorea hispida]AOM65375.1 DNA-directed RNA polymerase omega chain [Thorea hispida]ARX95937.1 DNA-directed RNA polymerase omega chain [Thorea hispida]